MPRKRGYDFGIAKASLRIGAMLVLFPVLSACDGMLPHLPPTFDETAETSQFVSVPPSAIWVYAPGAIAAQERGLQSAREQRIALPNRTTVRGDNTLLLLARYYLGPDIGRFQYEDFVHKVGGLPEPFQDISSGDLLSGEDELGPYFWSEMRLGENTVCVLSLRRLGSGTRRMPDNSNVMDVMLRNCVNGTADDALKPISAANIGNYQGGSTATASNPIRMLSPLAGPTP
ncbi:MAG: hypothetical protein ACOH2H_25655 [Cypionkella sp.]